jgi:predicted transposase YbfD/YdcC
MIVAERITDRQSSTETRYYISSLPAHAEQHLQATREHWGIENSLPWVLDLPSTKIAAGYARIMLRLI